MNKVVLVGEASFLNVDKGTILTRNSGSFKGKIYIVALSHRLEEQYTLIDLSNGERWCEPKFKSELISEINESSWDILNIKQINVEVQ